jgi:hypothetical protein
MLASVTENFHRSMLLFLVSNFGTGQRIDNPLNQKQNLLFFWHRVLLISPKKLTTQSAMAEKGAPKTERNILPTPPKKGKHMSTQHGGFCKHG